MGNAGSNQPVGHHHSSNTTREHRHAKEYPPPSPGKEGQAFIFDKKINQKLVFQSSHEEEEPYFAKVFLNVYYKFTRNELWEKNLIILFKHLFYFISFHLLID